MLRCMNFFGAAGLVLALAACAGADHGEAVSSGSAAESSGILPGTPAVTLAYFEESVGDRVFFAFDRYELSNDARLVLARQAAWLELAPSAWIVVQGHCDERGTREYNLALGARRAASVHDFLVSYGVPANRVETVSYGKERPVAVCSAESCWSQNRRAVSVVRGGVPGS